MGGVSDIELSTTDVPINALIASMCRSAQHVTLADRTVLYAQGEHANRLFLILDGFVKTSRICKDGTEITIELLKYGDIAGAIPNRQLPSEHEETARAIGDVVVKRVLAPELRGKTIELTTGRDAPTRSAMSCWVSLISSENPCGQEEQAGCG